MAFGNGISLVREHRASPPWRRRSRQDGVRLAPAPIIGADAADVASIDRDFRRRLRRRARNVLIAVLFLLAMLVAAAPSILSGDRARAKILESVNRRLAEKGVSVSADSWKLRWGRGQTLSGVRVACEPGDGSPSWLVTVPDATLDTTLWRLLPFGRLDAGDVTVEAPAVEVTLGYPQAIAPDRAPPAAADSESIAVPVPVDAAEAQPQELAAAEPDSTAPDAASAAAEGEGSAADAAAEAAAVGDEGGRGIVLPVTDVSLNLHVKAGSLRLRDASTGGEAAFDAISVEASLPSLSSPASASVELRTPSPADSAQGFARAAAEIPDPRAWALEGRRAGTFALSVRSFDLAALSPLVATENGAPFFAAGNADASLEGSFSLPSDFNAKVACAVTDLALSGSPEAPAATAQFSGTVGFDGEKITVDGGVLTSPWASASVAGSASLPDASGAASGEIGANINADLARIVRDFGPLLGVREGFGVSKGAMRSTFTLRGDDSGLLLKGGAAFSGPLAIFAEGHEYELAAPSLDFSLRKEGANPPRIDTLRLDTSFGRLAAAGDSAKALIVGTFDLARFYRDYGRLFQGLPEMSGGCEVNCRLEFQEAAPTKASVAISASRARVALSKDTSVYAGTGSIALSGSLPQSGGDAAKYAARLEGSLFDVRYSSKGKETTVVSIPSAFSAACEWSPADSALKFEEMGIDSEWGGVKGASGVLGGIPGSWDLSAAGMLAVDWGRIAKLLGEDGESRVAIGGREFREFRVEGPLADGAEAFLARASGEASTHISSLSAYGLEARPADAKVSLADGVAKVAYSPEINRGKSNIECDFALCERPRRVRSSKRLFLLEDARLNDTVAGELLGYVNPVLTQCSVRSGTISASIQPFDLPLDKEEFLKSSFNARLALDDVTLAPAGDFERILAIAKLDGQTLGLKHQAIDVACVDGRISTGEQRFGAGKHPVTFSGSATLSGEADYRIGIPVAAAVAAAAGEEYAAYVKDRVLTIPVTGTVKRPRIDEGALLSGVKRLVAETVGSGIKEEIKDNGIEILGNLLENLRDKAERKIGR